MAETASLAARMLGKSASMVRTAAGIGSSRTVMLQAMPNIPSLPTKRPTRSGPQASPWVGAEPGEGAVGENDLEVGDVIGGDAGLEAVRPAGVLGDVAPDGAGGLARGIGDVLQAVRQHGLREAGVDDTGLDHRAASGRVDVEDAVQPGEGHEHGVALGECTAAESPVPAPRATNGVFVRVELLHDGDELLARTGEDHHSGIGLVSGEAIHGIGGELGAAMPHPAGADDTGEPGEEGLVHASARSGG